MGQHKHNPNVQLAKEGKLPPKPIKIGKREQRRRLERLVRQKILDLMKGARSEQL